MIETIITDALRNEVIELLLAASTCSSLVLATLTLYGEQPDARTKDDEHVIGLAFDAVALLRDQDDFEEDETDEDYYIEAMLEAAQRLLEGRLKLP